MKLLQFIIFFHRLLFLVCVIVTLLLLLHTKIIHVLYGNFCFFCLFLFCFLLALLFHFYLVIWFDAIAIWLVSFRRLIFLFCFCISYVFPSIYLRFHRTFNRIWSVTLTQFQSVYASFPFFLGTLFRLRYFNVCMSGAFFSFDFLFRCVVFWLHRF